MGSESYHEPYEILSPETREMHRAITSLIEELQAVDWYQQRADAATDDELRAVLVHNKNEEIEHAMMGLEWIRRHSAKFDENLRTYLFTSGAITEVEAGAKEGGGEAAAKSGGGAPHGSLGIGSLKEA